jgi:hypothetical protein
MDPYQTSTGPNRLLVFIIGLIVGSALITAGLYVYSNYFSKEEADVSLSSTKKFALSVAYPKDGDTVSTAKTKISGTTGTKSVVVVNGGQEDTIVEATDGSFSIDYKLALGENQLTITVYDEDSGESRTENVNVLYLDENLDNL